MYRQNITQVGPMKKFKSKREMFKCIAQSISTKLSIIRSAHQCENRYISYKYFFSMIVVYIIHILLFTEELNLFRYKTVINQRKVGCSILQKSRSNVERRLNEEERLQNDVTASVSADHDYNGQNSGTNGNILQLRIYIF